MRASSSVKPFSEILGTGHVTGRLSVYSATSHLPLLRNSLSLSLSPPIPSFSSFSSARQRWVTHVKISIPYTTRMWTGSWTWKVRRSCTLLWKLWVIGSKSNFFYICKNVKTLHMDIQRYTFQGSVTNHEKSPRVKKLKTIQNQQLKMWKFTMFTLKTGK